MYVCSDILLHLSSRLIPDAQLSYTERARKAEKAIDIKGYVWRNFLSFLLVETDLNRPAPSSVASSNGADTTESGPPLIGAGYLKATELVRLKNRTRAEDTGKVVFPKQLVKTNMILICTINIALINIGISSHEAAYKAFLKLII